MQFYEIDRKKLKRYPIKERCNKVSVKQFAPPIQLFSEERNFLELLPDILVAKDLKEVVKHTVNAKRKKRAVIFAIGGHVIKCGLGRIIIDLMQREIVSAVLMNGAASIHDFEIAMIGETSEDVSSVLSEGKFGMAEETGQKYNEAIKTAYLTNAGMGYSLGKYIVENDFSHQEYSVLCAAYKLNIPVFVSVAIGDDITHMHPEAMGEALGAASYHDFLTFASVLPNLADGGVYYNIGSAVVLPEVFLKAFSIVENLGYNMSGLYTVNMDMHSQYRPLMNVVKRPTLRDGKGYHLIGVHEIMLPLLASAVVSELTEEIG